MKLNAAVRLVMTIRVNTGDDSRVNLNDLGLESRILFDGNECSAVSTTLATTTPSAAFVLVYSLLAVAPWLILI